MVQTLIFKALLNFFGPCFDVIFRFSDSFDVNKGVMYISLLPCSISGGKILVIKSISRSELSELMISISKISPDGLAAMDMLSKESQACSTDDKMLIF